MASEPLTTEPDNSNVSTDVLIVAALAVCATVVTGETDSVGEYGSGFHGFVAVGVGLLLVFRSNIAYSRL